MREFLYEERYKVLLQPDIIRLVGGIHEFKGRQDLYVQANPDTLETMMELARIQSTGASNRIEGIGTSVARLSKLVKEKAEPRNRSEQEIAGYRDVLRTIHDSYEFIQPRPNILLQLHRDLYAYSGSQGGYWKSVDNLIEEVDEKGIRRIRFQPVSAFETPQTMDSIYEAFERALAQDSMDPLILIPLFVLDFLCIHPFNDGNGRMSRLLLLLLLYRAGYLVGKYISLEMITEKTKESYYEALAESSKNWHEGKGDDTAFVRYSLGIVYKAYTDFAERVEHILIGKGTKTDRVQRFIRMHVGPFTKAEILVNCPDVSTSMVEKILSDLHGEGLIRKIGSGPSTAYVLAEQ